MSRLLQEQHLEFGGIELLKLAKGSPRGDEVHGVSIAVVGRGGVGKSTFIQRALDLKASPESPIASKKVSLEGSISVVRLIELDISEVFVIENALQWPKIVKDHPIPRLDGLLLLYDVLDHNTYDSVLAILGICPRQKNFTPKASPLRAFYDNRIC